MDLIDMFKEFRKMVVNLRISEKAQGMVEYGLILSLVSVIAISSLGVVGRSIGGNFDKVSGNIIDDIVIGKPETNVNYMKSATVAPYSLWDVNSVKRDVIRLNLNTVNVPLRVIVDEVGSNNMEILDEDIVHAKTLIAELEELDVDIIVEPFPWIADGSIGENEWDPENLDTWFYNWKHNVLKLIIDEIASPLNVDYLTVSNNFVNMEYATGYWKDVFSEVKNDFGFTGKVIYKTNWWITAEWDQSSKDQYISKLNNSLFGDENLDVISIASYFELSSKADPTVQEIKDGLLYSNKYNRGQNVYEEIRNFHWKWGKKIMLGELGVPSYDGYTSEPWNPSPEGYGDKYNRNAQYNYFKAYIETFTEMEGHDQSWFGGFSIFIIGDDDSTYKLRERNVINYISNL